MQNSKMDNIANGAKTAGLRSLGFPRGVGGEDNPALYCNVPDTTGQRVETEFKTHQTADEKIGAMVPPPKNHRDKTTEYITEAQATAITLAAKKAHDIGRPFNQYLTIRLDPNASPKRPQETLAAYLDRLRRWLKLHGSNATYFWILEEPEGKTMHAHLLLHVPLALQNKTKDGFDSWQQRAWYRCGIQLNAAKGILLTEPISPEGYDVSQHDKRETYFYNLRKLLKYHYKAIDPDDESRLTDDVSVAELFRIEKIAPQGTISGRRFSLSNDIRVGARKKLWPNGATTKFKARTAP